VQHEARHVRGREEQVRPERDLRVADPQGRAHVVARCQLPPLVELPVRRQVRLGRDAEHPSAVDHDCGVVDAVPVPQRGAHDEHRQQVGRAGNDLQQRLLDGVEQRVLHQDVFDGVARQRHLGEDGEPDPVVVALARSLEHGVGVGRGFSDRGVQRAGGDP
jgi:hypothetical protein